MCVSSSLLMMNSEVDVYFISIHFHKGKRCAAVHQVNNQVNCLCEPSLQASWKHLYWSIKEQFLEITGIGLVVDLVTDMESDRALGRFCRFCYRKTAAGCSQKLLQSSLTKLTHYARKDGDSLNCLTTSQ